MSFFSDFTLSAAVLWLVAGLILGAAEILVGTFYLLVVGASCVLAAAAAAMGLSGAWQFCIFAVAIIAGGLLVRRFKGRETPQDRQAQALQNADVGQIVVVHAWGEDGTALVDYRGAQWRARLSEGAEAATGPCVIEALDGAMLVVRPRKAQN